MSNAIALLFAPSFIISLHYLEFKAVVQFYLFLSILFFIYTCYTKKTLKNLVVPSIYVIALLFAYFSSSFEMVKFIPVLISATFFALFIDATMYKKELILGFTKRFYKRELSKEEVLFLKDGDAYWAIITLINTLIQLALVFYGSNTIWAFYSSIGWYGFFFTSLVVQIVYGRLYAIKLYS
ncbi:hypothetical protein [Sulfurimonas sp. CS5]|jgi:uncharacterized membrane protein|uniref:hypothetical protein n=1 Tax=Sulfurimonas sp. CS5 TaxID=3391145 RepID=UPI0039EBEEB6